MCLLQPLKSQAGIFENFEDMDISQRNSISYTDTILTGKIIAINSESRLCENYASATLIAKPGDMVAKTVLSCAHFFLGTPFCDYKFSFKGVDYDIKNTLMGCDETCLNSKDDVSVSHLETPISLPNPCQTEISSYSPSEVHLSSVSYGWAMTKNLRQKEINNYGQNSYLLQNTFRWRDEGWYSHSHTADKLISVVYDDENNFNHYYVASGNSSHQSFNHDSGSSWFTKNETNGLFSLTALTSRATTPDYDEANPYSIGNPYDQDQIVEAFDTEFSGDPLSFRILNLLQKTVFEDILTPLFPHREWIYQQIDIS